MKNNFVVNAVVAAASALFAVGAIAEKSQVKDLGLGMFLATSIVKQQRDRQDCVCVSNNIDEWQQNILTEIAGLSRSLEKTDRELSQVNRTADNQKLDRAIKQITKIENRLLSQEKQQNKMRSLLDKLRHQMKPEIETIRKSQSFRKNFDCLAKPIKLTSQLIAQQPTTHVYIDGNNFKCAAYKLNLSVDYRALKFYLMPGNGKIRLNFYDGVCNVSKFERNKFHLYLNSLGYVVNKLPQRIHQDGTHKTVGDDISIAIDIVETVKAGDCLIIISGDGDFFPVIKRIQQRQVKVTAIALATCASNITRNQVDEFINLDDLKQLIAKSDNSKAA